MKAITCDLLTLNYSLTNAVLISWRAKSVCLGEGEGEEGGDGCWLFAFVFSL